VQQRLPVRRGTQRLQRPLDAACRPPVLQGRQATAPGTARCANPVAAKRTQIRANPGRRASLRNKPKRPRSAAARGRGPRAGRDRALQIPCPSKGQPTIRRRRPPAGNGKPATRPADSTQFAAPGAASSVTTRRIMRRSPSGRARDGRLGLAAHHVKTDSIMPGKQGHCRDSSYMRPPASRCPGTPVAINSGEPVVALREGYK
jgi:hypothetical protein